MNFGIITSWVSTTGSLQNTHILYVSMAGCWWYVRKMSGSEGLLIYDDLQLDDVVWYVGLSNFRPLLTPPAVDTIYACQDIEDDIKVGVCSTAILFGSWIFPLLTMCGVTFVVMLVIAGYLNGQGMTYFIIAVGGTTAHLIWQFLTVDLKAPHSCWREFCFLSI